MQLKLYPCKPGGYDPELFGACNARTSRSKDSLEDLLNSGKPVDKIYNYLDFGHFPIGDNIRCCVDFQDITMLEAMLLWYNIKVGEGTESSSRYLNLGGLEKTDKFDNLRYILPVSTLTNVRITTTIREWAKVTRYLLSHFSPRVNILGKTLYSALKEEFSQSFKNGDPTDRDFDYHQKKARPACLKPTAYDPSVQWVGVSQYPKFSCNPYAIYDLNELQREWAKHDIISFDVNNVTIAEARDINRHRSGSTTIDWEIDGFWSPIKSQVEDAYEASMEAYKEYHSGDLDWQFKLLLGNQLDSITRTTTMDKFIYEWQLRTGKGSHFKYREAYEQIAEKIGLKKGDIIKC